VSELGDWLYSISIYSLLLELTGSAQSIALPWCSRSFRNSSRRRPRRPERPAETGSDHDLRRPGSRAIVLLMMVVQTRQSLAWCMRFCSPRR